MVEIFANVFGEGATQLANRRHEMLRDEMGLLGKRGYAYLRQVNAQALDTLCSSK